LASWSNQIDTAESVGEVVSITRDYLATWMPDELALLPQTCRPGRIKGEEDIAQLHDCLVDEYRQNRLGGEEFVTLQRMTSFVVRAAVRIARLQSN
jgi:hypothetical protein